MRFYTSFLIVCLASLLFVSCSGDTTTNNNTNTDTTTNTVKGDSTWVRYKNLNLTAVTAVGGDGNKMYASTLGKGVWVSLDKGANWSYTGLADTAILTVSNGGEFIGSQNFGAYANLNNSSWKNSSNGLAPPLTSPRINSFYKLNNTWFAATARGIFNSNDNGQNWNKISGGLPDDVSTGFFCLNGTGNTIYAGSNGFGIYKSGNAGANWELVTPDTLEDLIVHAISVDKDGIVFAACDSMKVLKSTDAGNTWTTLLGGFPYRATARSIISTGDLVVMGTEDHGFYRWQEGSSLQTKRWVKFSKGDTATKVFDIRLLPSGELLAGTDEGVYRCKYK